MPSITPAAVKREGGTVYQKGRLHVTHEGRRRSKWTERKVSEMEDLWICVSAKADSQKKANEMR